MKSLLTVEVAPMTVFARLAREGFAHVDIPAQYQGTARWNEVRFDGVHFSSAMSGLILEGDAELNPLTLADVQQLTGTWSATTNVRHKQTFVELDSVGNGALQSTAVMAAMPHLICIVERTMPETIALAKLQQWSFTFGGVAEGYTILWDRFGNPKLLQDIEPVAEYPLQEGEREAFSSDAVQRWEIAVVPSGVSGTVDIYISCSSLSEPWIIRQKNMPDASPWFFAVQDDAPQVNVTVVTFPASGTYSTPMIEHDADYPDADLHVRTFPSAIGDYVAVTVSRIIGTLKRYQLTLTRLPDGTTPLVQAIELVYAPTFTTPEGDWLDLSAFPTGGNEDIPAETNTRVTSLTLSLTRRDDSGAQLDEVLPNFRGQWACRYSTGYRYPTGEEYLQQRMIGIIKGRRRNTGRSVELTIADRWTQLAEKRLVHAPLLHGRTVNAAIALLATWGGVDPDLIVSIAQTPPVEIPIPPHGFQEPTWRPDGTTTVAEYIRTLTQRFGVMAAFQPDGTFRIYRNDATTVVAEFSANEGTDPAYMIGEGKTSGLEIDEDLSGVITTVWVEGRTPDGTPIFGRESNAGQIDTPNTNGFVGYRTEEYIRDDNLATQEAVNTAAHNAFFRRHTGNPVATLSAVRGYAMVHCWPGQYITVTGPERLVPGGSVTGRLRQVSVQFRQRAHRPTLVIDIDPLYNPLPAAGFFTIGVSTIGGVDIIKGD